MTRILSVSLLKGGTGKTTTAVHLAHGLARHQRRVLLIDCDVQGQVSSNLGVTHPVGLSEFVSGKAGLEEALVQARPELYVLAGGNGLAGLAREISRTDFRSEEMLRSALTPLEEYFDYILLDTAPGYNPLLINVLFYAREIICPVTLETMAMQGLLDFVERLKGIQQHHPARLAYVVPTMLDRRYAQSSEILAELEQHFAPVLCPPIRTDVKLSEAPAYQQTVFEIAPQGRGAKDYEQLTQRVLRDEQQT